ncbi:unnamed protein product [Cercopithifilaria johnstoni]|uniref:SSD domain-containing protein n=1 Tax=Cercopithifilaria johnstoni TaxID=2874296 RepID=A0A8J2PVP6_9BILA|nr:unnamed protein product [Cercopithifilaria johnstoni]
MKWKKFSHKLETIITKIRDSYVKFLLNYSWFVIISVILISLCLSVYAALFCYDTFTFNPLTGFETRNTFLSNQRLALDNLIDRAVTNEHIKSISKREITDNNVPRKYDRLAHHKNTRETKLEIPLNACQQYFVLGAIIPHELILVLSKLIFKVSSFNSLFNMHIMERLCAIDSIIDNEINLNGLNTTNIKRLSFSFNLPYYTMCLNMNISSSNSCSSLDSNYIDVFKSLVLACQSDESLIQCQLPIAKQLSNMIFQKNDGPIDVNQPLHFAVVLPILQSADGYSHFHFYSSLLQKFQENYNDDELKLVGAQFGIKEGLFVKELRNDIRLGVLAVILTIFIILIYTDSFFYTFCITATLLLSISVAFFVYTVIFGIKFFPFLNLLAMILVVAVGADDAFLFMYQYRKHKEDATKKWSPVLLNCESNNTKEENSDKQELMEYHRQQVITGLSDALSHAAISMLVTSATTAVAFFANLASEIMVLRCFGIYAGILMMINYMLVMIILPAAIVVSDGRVKSFNISTFFVWRIKSRITQLWHNAATSIDIVFSRIISQIVYIVRLPLTLLALIAFVISIYAIVKTPGIRLPEKNSIQFLRSNHPYEWFDENAATLFDFSNGQRPKMNVIAIWGIKPTTDGSLLIPKEKGSLNIDSGFADILANHLLEFQITLLKYVSHQINPNVKQKLWLDEFIKWTNLNTTSKSCRLFSVKQSGLSTPKSFSGNMLSHCFLQFGHAKSLPIFDQWQRNDNDGPIFDKNGTFLVYFLLTYSKYNLSTIFKEMKPFFDFIKSIKMGESEISEFNEPLILTTNRITKLYDLFERILNGTAISVFISLMVSMIVIIFITFNVILSFLAIICIATVVTVTIGIVLWAGWTVNVVEATIIVLTIGMSFDYCLHFAVGFRLHKTANYR